MTTDIVFLPGMGADVRLFHQQLKVFNGRVPRWIAPLPRETMSHYAKRFAKSFEEPKVMVGVSFGGMMALELASIISVKKTILIASALSRSELATPLRWLLPLSHWLKAPRPSRFQWTSALLARHMGARRHHETELFVAMLNATDPAFTQWAMRAIAGWTKPTQYSGRLYRIQGAKDRVIPTKKNIDYTIKDAGHLVNLTHAREVNQHLQTILGGRSLCAEC